MSCTLRAGRWLPLAILLSICTPAVEAVAGADTAVSDQSTAVLDLPGDAELLAAYQGDRSNQKVQTWKQYRGWVKTFYQGNLMSDGWNKFGEVTAGTVKSAEARQAVAARITELGRIIGLEWAKDSSAQKITTSDLRRWNDFIARARQSDDGSGRQIIAALEAVRSMAKSRR